MSFMTLTKDVRFFYGKSDAKASIYQILDCIIKDTLCGLGLKNKKN